VLQGEARVRTSKYRATREYRRHLLGVLLRRVLTEAGSPLMSGGVISMQPGER
jgi:CO/xanthine dehydrogenase FAD-binding subunit